MDNLELEKEQQLVKKLLATKFLLRFPQAIEQDFLIRYRKQFLAIFEQAYPMAIVAMMINGAITLLNPNTFSLVALHCWAGITLIYLLGYLFYINEFTRSHFDIYHGVIMIPLMALVLLRALAADTLVDQVTIFVFIGFYYICSYSALRIKEASIWCLSSGVLALVLALLTNLDINWPLFHLYFSFTNFIGLLLSTQNEILTRYAFLQSKLLKIEKQLLNELTQKFDELSRKDGLTQIPNRRHFDDSYPKQWAHCSRSQVALSILFIDIDYYKKYNDTYGHIAGDVCLVRIAKLLKRELKRATDLVARYGGEEFVVVLPDTDKGGAIHVAERIQEAIAEQAIEHKSSDVSPYITASIGIASCYPSEKLSPAVLVEQADASLYQAKDEGRNRWKLTEILPDTSLAAHTERWATTDSDS